MVNEFICKLCPFDEYYEEFTAPHKCPNCNSKWYTLRFCKEITAKPKFVSIGYKDTPRYSVSLGVPETQIEDAKRMHPQAEWKKFGHSYRPLIKNRAEKLKMMQQAGFAEFDTKQFKGKD